MKKRMEDEEIERGDCAQCLTLYFTNTCKQRAGPACIASQKDPACGVSEYARIQQWVHNDLKREWLCVLDDALKISPWQTPKNGVSYFCSRVLLVHENVTEMVYRGSVIFCVFTT